MSSPSSVSSLVGLRGARRLVEGIASSPVHAVLLYGVAGAGKATLARELVLRWLSVDPEGAPRRSYERGNNPDVLWIRPAGASAIIGKSAIVPGDGEPETRPLVDFFRTGPIASEHKIAVIEEADRMSDEAANSLLKPLEEPFPYAKLVLTSSAIGSVLPTILSRCLAVPCELPSDAELTALVPEGREFAELARGAPGELAGMAAKPEPYRALVAFARDLKGATPIDALVMADRLRGIGDALAKAHDTGARAGNARAIELLARLVSRDPSLPTGWTLRLVEAHRRVLGNASAGLTLDALFATILTRR